MPAIMTGERPKDSWTGAIDVLTIRYCNTNLAISPHQSVHYLLVLHSRLVTQRIFLSLFNSNGILRGGYTPGHYCLKLSSFAFTSSHFLQLALLFSQGIKGAKGVLFGVGLVLWAWYEWGETKDA